MSRNQEHTLTKKKTSIILRLDFQIIFFSFNLNIEAYSKHLATIIDNSKQDQTKKKIDILCINQNQS